MDIVYQDIYKGKEIFRIRNTISYNETSTIFKARLLLGV